MSSSSEDGDPMDVSSDAIASRTRTSRTSQAAAASSRTKERWEDIQRSWDLVTEGVDGSLSGTVEGLLEAGKRKRILRDTTPLQRGIIRHLVLIIDLSSAMSEKDLRPTRYLLTLRITSDFITDFFEQNPISQLAIIGMRDGLAVRISDMSGNPTEHIAALSALQPQEPKGVPSLQNALEMARAALFHSPSHGTREVLIVFGALLSSDPGDIHSTVTTLVRDSIRVNIVGLAARVAVCQEICARTNGVSKDNMSVYTVALHEQHLRDLIFQYITPPATAPRRTTRNPDGTTSTTPTPGVAHTANDPSLLMMGFPSRVEEAHPTLCACHARLTRGGYLCSRCASKVCGLPAQCPGCGLQLVQSTHLARSYHHLFPLRNYVEVSWDEARARTGAVACFACLTSFPQIPKDKGRARDAMVGTLGDGAARLGNGVSELQDPGAPGAATRRVQRGASESSRYACQSCGEHFCIDCDVLSHEVLHNCAGCLCKPLPG